MRRRIVFWVSTLLLAAGLSFAAAEIVEEIVAVVNDDIITLSQYKQFHDSYVQFLRQQFQGEEFDKQYQKAKGEMLNTMIQDLLLLQAAKQKQLNVTEQVKATINNLKKENNIDTDDQLREEFQRQGGDFDQFVKQVEENLMRQAVVFSEVDRSIVIDESEVVGYYKLHPEEFIEPEEYKLRAIYLAPEGRTKEDLEARKKEISDKVRTGGDFVELAGETSDSPLKENKGDLGFIKKGELDKTLEQAVAKLKPGEITPWITAKNAWYLIKLEEKKESRQRTFEEAKKDIEQKLFQEKRNKKLNEYLKQVKEKSYIKILKPNPLNL